MGNNIKDLEQELIKNNYTYMDHCFSGTKLGEDSIESLSKLISDRKLEDQYATIMISKESLGSIISMLLNYEDVLWKHLNDPVSSDDPWTVGDLFEELHDITTGLGYKVYSKSDKTPKDCKMNDYYVI